MTKEKVALILLGVIGIAAAVISSQEASGATTTSKQIASLNRQVSDLKKVIQSLSEEVEDLSMQVTAINTKQNGYEEKTIRYLALPDVFGNCPSGYREFLGRNVAVPIRGVGGNFTSTQALIECISTVAGR